MTRNANNIPPAALASSGLPPSVAHQHRGLASRCIALGCAVVMAAVLAGCSSTETVPTASSSPTAPTVPAAPTGPTASSAPTASSSSYPADKQELCQARDQFESAVKALTDPALLTQGAAAIKAAVSQVQTDLQSVKTAAKQDSQPQIDALQASLQDVQAAVGHLGDGSAGHDMAALATAVASVGTGASALLTRLKATCS